jgi:hypothetical protein
MAWITRDSSPGDPFNAVAGFVAMTETSQIHLALLSVPSTMATDEDKTWTTVESWTRQASGVGATATDAVVLVQPTMNATAESQPFTVWYDDGRAIVAWGNRGPTDRFTAAYITAQHEHAPFSSVTDAEGNLAQAYATTPLIAGCGFHDVGAVTTADETLKAADSWRTAMPFAQHFARRLVICNDEAKAMLTLVQVHPDVVANVDPQKLVADQSTNAVQTAGNVPVVAVDNGLLWFQQDRIYLLKTLRSNTANTATTAELTDMMMAIILQSH